MTLLVIGNITLDFIANVDRFPRPGRTALISNSGICYGGRGANVAVICAKLGLSVVLASLVGEDFPAKYRRHLQSANVDISKVKIIKGSSCARIFAFINREHSLTYYIEPIIYSDVSLPISDTELGSYRGIFITPFDSDKHIWNFARILLKSENVFLALGEEVYRKDPKFLRYAFSFPQYVFMNQEEFRETIKRLKVNSSKDILQNSPRLRAIIVTEGKNGSKAYTLKKVLSVPSVPTSKRTELGAGDAFTAGVIYSILSGLSILDSLKIGTVVAAMAIENDFVQLLTVDWEKFKKRFMFSFNKLPKRLAHEC